MNLYLDLDLDLYLEVLPSLPSQYHRPVEIDDVTFAALMRAARGEQPHPARRRRLEAAANAAAFRARLLSDMCSVSMIVCGVLEASNGRYVARYPPHSLDGSDCRCNNQIFFSIKRKKF